MEYVVTVGGKINLGLLVLKITALVLYESLRARWDNESFCPYSCFDSLDSSFLNRECLVHSLLDWERYQTSCPSRYARHLTRGFKGEYSEVNRMPCVFGRNPQRNKQCQMLRNDTRVINPYWLWDNRGMLFKAGGTGNEPWRIDCDANNCTTQEEGNDRKQIRLSVFRKALQCPFKQTNIRTVLNLPAYYLSLDFRAWRVGVL